jgi:hypothetical protein
MPPVPRPMLARVHRVVIGAAIALALIFAAYAFKRREPALSVASAAAAVALGFYLRWFSRKPLNPIP